MTAQAAAQHWHDWTAYWVRSSNECSTTREVRHVQAVRQRCNHHPLRLSGLLHYYGILLDRCQPGFPPELFAGTVCLLAGGNLAQQVVAMCALDEWTVADLGALGDVAQPVEVDVGARVDRDQRP